MLLATFKSVGKIKKCHNLSEKSGITQPAPKNRGINSVFSAFKLLAFLSVVG